MGYWKWIVFDIINSLLTIWKKMTSIWRKNLIYYPWCCLFALFCFLQIQSTFDAYQEKPLAVGNPNSLGILRFFFPFFRVNIFTKKFTFLDAQYHFNWEASFSNLGCLLFSVGPVGFFWNTGLFQKFTKIMELQLCWRWFTLEFDWFVSGRGICKDEITNIFSSETFWC